MTKDACTPVAVTELVGTWRRFGPTGPVYHVLGPSDDPGKVEIKVLVSGEELAYDVAKAALDPDGD